jgi:hypothetical protein
MSETIAKQIQELRRMSVSDLRAKYREVFGEGTRSGNKDWMWKRIAWRIQQKAYGGLSERAKQRALSIADEDDIRMRVPAGAFDAAMKGNAMTTGTLRRDKRIPPTGTVLNREYKGEKHSVTVLDNGFEYDGRRFLSLSAVAREISGSHWNGYAFFNL